MYRNMSDDPTISMLATLAVMLAAAIGCSLAALLVARIPLLNRVVSRISRLADRARPVTLSVGGLVVGLVVLAAVLGLVKPEVVLRPAVGITMLLTLMFSFAMISMGQLRDERHEVISGMGQPRTLKIPPHAERRAA